MIICKHKDCTTRAHYGKKGSRKKEYCKTHIPDDCYVCLNGICKHPNCTTRASFGYSGYSSEYCSKHKKPRMIIYPKSKPKEEDIQCQFCLASIHYDELFCSGCKRYLELGTTVKTHEKELRVKSLLDEDDIKYTHDKIIGESKRRPDFRIYTNETEYNIILEVDENKHGSYNYNCECEIIRMKQIYNECGKSKMLFIRYNPDKFKSITGEKFTQQQKEKYLMKYLNERISDPIEENGLYVVYLFYDGFLSDEPEIEKVY